MLSRHKSQAKPVGDEATQYLDGDPIDTEPLQFWKEHQGHFPTIAALIRDILSIPVTSAGVERLFNTARDICHYRRGRMKSETIEELIMFLCTSRFDIKEREAKELERFFSLNEIEAAKEEKDDRLDDIEIDPISDTEELDNRSNNLIDVDEVNKAQDKEDKDSLALPETNTQIRVSGRKRKYREDDIFEHY
ncbi:hypothetical protein PEX1_030960 [Penicillium expansum]|nr:hypothetical protein PEX1_030960 [Penicillium expansum]